MTAAVVILNWNGKRFLKKFLPDLIQHTAHLAEIIVADNASGDDSVPFMKENYPEIRLIELQENTGFTGGYNNALNYIDADYYVLLNSDVQVTPNWLEPLINHMENHPDTAVCQPRIKSYHQKDTFEYAGAAGGYIDKFGYPFCRGRIFDKVEKDNGQYNDLQNIFWATGACMITRSEIWHKNGGLDNDFFAHMEEIDYCWRCQNLGYDVKYIPQSTVYHVGAGTLPKNNPFKTYLNFRNNLTLLFKNQSTKKFYRIYRIRLFLDLLAAVKFLFNGQGKDFKAIFRAHNHFRANKARHAAKKQNIPEEPVKGIYLHSIVRDFHIKGKNTFSALNKSDFTGSEK